MSDELTKAELVEWRAETDRAFWSSLDATGSLFRWILASLITLNGGAIVLVLSWDNPVAARVAPAAALWFFVGCVFAVAGAMLLALSIALIGFDIKRYRPRRKGDGSVPPSTGKVRPGVWGLGLCGLSLLAFVLGGIKLAIPFLR